MKWLLIVSLVFIILIIAIVRQRTLARRPAPPPPVWETRSPISFEQFYDRYYAESGLSEPTVFKMMEFISLASSIDYRLILPDDRLDDFPNGSLRKHVLEFGAVLVNAKQNRSQPTSRVLLHAQIDTIDDFIRKLGPLAARVEEQQRQLHHT